MWLAKCTALSCASVKRQTGRRDELNQAMRAPRAVPLVEYGRSRMAGSPEWPTTPARWALTTTEGMAGVEDEENLGAVGERGHRWLSSGCMLWQEAGPPV